MMHDSGVIGAVDRDDVIGTLLARFSLAVFVDGFNRDVQPEPIRSRIEQISELREVVFGHPRRYHGRKRTVQPSHGGVVKVPSALEHGAGERGNDTWAVFGTDRSQYDEPISHKRQCASNLLSRKVLFCTMAQLSKALSPISSRTTELVAHNRWQPERPSALVVCCSDGRLQESIDEFLSTILGIVHCDRMFAPGGPAAISEVGASFARTHHFRSDLQFLLEAHDFRKIILIFHGAAEDGPDLSVCAHYRRIMPHANYAEITARHEADHNDIVHYLQGLRDDLEILAFRAEVTADRRVKFVNLSA